MSTSPGLFCAFSVSDLQRLLSPTAQWHPFPQAADREAWQKLQRCELNNRRGGYLIGRAESLCPDGPARNGNVAFTTDPWPELSATEYMNFIRTGDREHYEGPYFQRRHNLAILTLAECIEGKGRFLDEIINGLWAIGGEPTWCIPAHTLRIQTGDDWDAFPDLAKPSVDLFASETAFTLAECLYLVGAELDARCPAVRTWIHRLIDERIVAPVETRDDFWWLAGANNWTPWCCANTLGALLYTVDDNERVARITHKLLGALQRYYDRYSPDGGCDEGPMYWTVSPGALLLALEMLYDRSGGKLDFYADAKIRAMGEYLPKVHLAGRWLVNFADARDSGNLKRAGIYRYGERIGNPAMKNIALLSARDWSAQNQVDPLFPGGHCCGDLVQMLRELWWIPGDVQPVAPVRESATWFPELQVAVWRACTDDSRGLIFAGKAGHNEENHNHNDLGHFILMLDGQPGIIDIGIGMYSRLNFSDKRYTLWSIRGSGHNGPVVNGQEQAAGREHTTHNVSFISEKTGAATLAMNLEDAYPADAGLKVLRRKFHLTPGDQGVLVLTDEYELASANGEFTLNLYTPRAATRIRPGLLHLHAQGGRTMGVEFDPKSLEVEVRERPLNDEPLLRRAWGDALQHLVFTHKANKNSGQYALRFYPAEMNK